MERCPWCMCNEKMIRYHDEEWGVPVHDDQKQFEFLMMEVMQCYIMPGAFRISTGSLVLSASISGALLKGRLICIPDIRKERSRQETVCRTG